MLVKMFKTVSWRDISEKVERVSPDLYNVICDISPDDSYPLFLMESSYGDDINKAYNENSNTRPLLGLQLSRVTEEFDEYNGEPSNFHTYVPGDLLFLDAAMAYLENLPFSCTSKYVSGVRSAFMVPRISDSRSHQRILSCYKFNTPTPKKTIYEHWEVFKGIANSKLQSHKWSSELLYFSDSWFKHKNDKSWSNFYKYIYKQAFLRRYNLKVGEPFWGDYLDSVKSIKCGPYSIETVKRILDILLLSKHGYIFACDNEDYLPIRQIQSAYNEVYQIGSNAPIIMHARKYDANLKDNSIPIYYSLSVPDIKNARYISRGIQSANQELRMLVKLNGKLISLVNKYSDGAIDQNIAFKYFHSEDSISSFSESIQLIQKTDPTLQEILKNQYPGKTLPSYSNFLRGALQINCVNSNKPVKLYLAK